jgi:hypothetical protein
MRGWQGEGELAGCFCWSWEAREELYLLTGDGLVGELDYKGWLVMNLMKESEVMLLFGCCDCSRWMDVRGSGREEDEGV